MSKVVRMERSGIWELSLSHHPGFHIASSGHILLFILTRAEEAQIAPNGIHYLRPSWYFLILKVLDVWDEGLCTIHMVLGQANFGPQPKEIEQVAL